MATGSRREAFGAYYFAIEIGGIQDAFFRSCQGLKSESEVVELAEGGVNATTHTLIGRTKWPNIVLKQGFAGSTLWNLRRSFLDDSPGKPLKRFNGVIIQKGPNRTEAKWRFERGWICKWEGPEFDATKNELSIETIEIAHEGLVVRGGIPTLTTITQKHGAGLIHEELVIEQLKKEGYVIVGEQVYAETSEGTRIIDVLVEKPGGGYKAIEIKSGMATRTPKQLKKDSLLKEEGAILGKNAPASLRGQRVKIDTEVRKW